MPRGVRAIHLHNWRDLHNLILKLHSLHHSAAFFTAVTPLLRMLVVTCGHPPASDARSHTPPCLHLHPSQYATPAQCHDLGPCPIITSLQLICIIVNIYENYLHIPPTRPQIMPPAFSITWVHCLIIHGLLIIVFLNIHDSFACPGPEHHPPSIPMNIWGSFAYLQPQSHRPCTLPSASLWAIVAACSHGSTGFT